MPQPPSLAPQISPALLTLVKNSEGLRCEPYRDPVGYPTIGYGHRIPSMNRPPVTVYEAEQILIADLKEAQNKALVLCPNLVVWPGPLDALTDLVFNVGERAIRGSRTCKLLREEKWAEAATRFRTWDKAHDENGDLVALPGLTKRRATAAKWIEEAGNAG